MRRIRTSSRRIGVEMTEYFLFFDDRYLVKVIDHVEAFRFVNGKWHEADGFRARVTGMGGDCASENVTETEAKKLFPTAFD